MFVLILLAACIHALWNFIIKDSKDTLAATAQVTLAGALIAWVTLPFLTPPASTSWAYIGASTVLPVAYFMLIA